MKLGVFGFVLFSFAVSYADCPPREGGFPDCSESHCSRVRKNGSLNNWCIKAGLGGCPMLNMEVGRDCFCICSCVAGDTLILLANGQTKMARDINEGDEVASPFGARAVSRVVALTSSDATGFAALKLFFNNGRDIVVSENHVFLGMDGGYHSADALKVGDLLASQTNTPIVLTAVERIESFKGLLFNLIINESSIDDKDHLLITNSLVSGDFILQNNADRHSNSVIKH